MEEADEIVVSLVIIWKFLRRYGEQQCLSHKEGSGHPSKITPEVKAVVEQQMNTDDETTAYHLHKLLTEKGFSLCISTILCCRIELGWMFRGNMYSTRCNLFEVQKRKLYITMYLRPFSWAHLTTYIGMF